MSGGGEGGAVADRDDHGRCGPDAHAGQGRQEVEKREGLQQGGDLLLGLATLGVGGGELGGEPGNDQRAGLGAGNHQGLFGEGVEDLRGQVVGFARAVDSEVKTSCS